LKGLSRMTLQASLLSRLNDPKLSHDQRAELLCELAKEREEYGDYEGARQALGGLWQRVGERPKIEGLERNTSAEVLLRAGVLTGWIGSKQQITDAQETAKNLISESISIFESSGHTKKVSEAQIDLAYCYWREGAYDEARDVLKDALSRISIDSELKAKAILRSAIVERGAARYKEALRILTNNAPLFEKVKSHTIKGGFHNALAGVLEDLGASEKKQSYIDRAFVEYAAAAYHFEQAGHKTYRANVENNLGFLFFKVGKFKEAHEHLNYARRLLMYLKDSCGVAQVNETRARVFLAEGHNSDAERAAGAAVRTLENSGQQALLAEALISHATALARLGYYNQSRSTFQRAVGVAQMAGALNRAQDAAQRMAEELGERLDTEAPAIAGSVLDEEMRRHERELIRQALEKAQGSVTQAARLLGITHQRLIYLLERRHKDLDPFRTPAKRRPKSFTKRK
jgi:tetratricopeptide (TPR) repeat protein